MNNRSYISIEETLGVYNNRLWYFIPGYNGYEISNDGYVRSMKHWRKYPFGILLKHDKNYIYTLTNNNNERKKLHYDEIVRLSRSDEAKKQSGYPRPTNYRNNASRNPSYTTKQRFSIDRDKVIQYPFSNMEINKNLEDR